LTIVNEYGNEQILEVTDVHPVWVVTDDPDLERAAREFADGVWHHNIAPTENGFWVEAKDLLVGDVFLGANGELSTLVDIERVELEESVKVYNFTVEGNHNYFVIATDDEFGQTCVLVHNAWPYVIRAGFEIGKAGVKRVGAWWKGTPKPAKPPAPPKAPPQVPAMPKIDPIKLNNHIFVPKHNLQPLLNAFGGSATQAYTAVWQATQTYVTTHGVTGVFQNIVVVVNGLSITGRGNVINGVVHIGTFFIP
jgi:hypothetical protein